MRVALYARYSSDLQSETSAADQLAVLRTALRARKWKEAAAFVDEGISGSALATRPGVLALMRAAAGGGFDAVLVESLSRLSRGQADVARLYELLSFYQVRLETLSSGVVTEMHIGMEGTMNRRFLVDLAQSTRRGLVERVNAGFSGGGHCYGYDIVGKGELAINPDEAQVIRRIFADYSKSKSARTIAGELNAEGVAAPRGGTWAATTIAGDRRARDGILCQELYAGMRVFNRRRFRKHPETGRRSSVLNPPEQWIRKPAPHLRIVPDALWQAVQARQAAISASPKPHAPRPKRLLSGLIHCGACGAPMWLQGGKYACSAQRERGTCENRKIIAARTVESRVLEGVKARLLAPEVIAAAVRAYHEEATAARNEALRDRAPIERELAELARRIDRAADSYERGLFELGELEGRLAPLRARQAQLREALALVDEPAPVRLHPKAPEFYAGLVEDLAGALEGDDAAEAREILRGAIERVDFMPVDGLGKFDLVVHGKLAALLGISERAAAGCEVVVGAGTRSGENLTALRVSFAA